MTIQAKSIDKDHARMARSDLLREFEIFLNNPDSEINFFAESVPESRGSHSHRHYELLFFRKTRDEHFFKLNIVPPGVIHNVMSASLYPEGTRLILTRSLFTGSDGGNLIPEFMGSSAYLDLLICDFEQIMRCKNNNLSKDIESRHFENMRQDMLHMLKYHINFRNRISRRNHITAARAYIQMNSFRVNLQMSEVADYLGINVCSLSKLFRKNTGMTARQFLMQTRMLRACEMMVEYDYELYEVAAHSGWSDYKYFAKVCRDTFNMSASELMKKLRSGEITLKQIAKILGFKDKFTIIAN